MRVELRLTPSLAGSDYDLIRSFAFTEGENRMEGAKQLAKLFNVGGDDIQVFNLDGVITYHLNIPDLREYEGPLQQRIAEVKTECTKARNDLAEIQRFYAELDGRYTQLCEAIKTAIAAQPAGSFDVPTDLMEGPNGIYHPMPDDNAPALGGSGRR